MHSLKQATGSIFSSFNCRVIITKYFWMSFSRFWLKMLNLIILVITQIFSREYQPTSIFQRNFDAFMNFTMYYYDVMSLHFWWGHYQAILVIMAWLKSLHAFLAIMPGTYLPTWVLRTIHILHTCHDKIFLKGPFDDGGLTLNHFMHYIEAKHHS